jgi:ABC-2 type transport system permease protein
MPYQALPKFVQFLSDALPTSPFLKTFISIVQSGGSLSDNLPSVIHLIILWIIFEGLLILRIKYLVSSSITENKNRESF